jgi:methylated-DNA-protein-cysteine methyltransferase-like protein
MAVDFPQTMPNRRPTFAQLPAKFKRRIVRDGIKPNQLRDVAFRRVIRSIPKGKVSTYGRVAAAAGYPLYHRAVARLLRLEPGVLPWHRGVGAAGEIKLRGAGAAEQRLRLGMETVRFRGRRVDMAAHAHALRPWEN